MFPVVDGAPEPATYATPAVTDLGDLRHLTAVSQLFVLGAVDGAPGGVGELTFSGSGAEFTASAQRAGGTDGAGPGLEGIDAPLFDVAGEAVSGSGPGSGDPGSAGGGVAGTDGTGDGVATAPVSGAAAVADGDLPFTGFQAAVVAAAGAATTATGAVLRRVAGRTRG